LNTALVKQLREYLAELMMANSATPGRFVELQADDKTLSEYILERDSGMKLFDWIRDFKDFDIRQAL